MIARAVIVHRVIVIRTIAFPKTVPLETGPLVAGLRVIVPTDAVTAVTVVTAAIVPAHAPMDVVTIVLRASPVALMGMARAPMNAVMTKVGGPQLRVGSVRIDRPRDAFVIALSERPIDTVLAMSVASRPNGPALATLVLDPSGPSNNPRPKLRRHPQTI